MIFLKLWIAILRLLILSLYAGVAYVAFKIAQAGLPDYALLMLALGWGVIWVYGKLGQRMAE